MDVREATELTSKAFINWCAVEQSNGYDPEYQDDEIKNTLTSSAIRSKILEFNLPVIVPDGFIVVTYLCTENNPGQSLLIFYELLSYINRVQFQSQGITPGYVITSMDFAMCFARSFPLMQDKDRFDEYYKKWQAQKRERIKSWDSDNQIDYKEYWEPLFRK